MTIEDVYKEAEELSHEIKALIAKRDALSDSVDEMKRLSVTLEASIAQLRGGKHGSRDTSTVLDG